MRHPSITVGGAGELVGVVLGDQAAIGQVDFAVIPNSTLPFDQILEYALADFGVESWRAICTPWQPLVAPSPRRPTPRKRRTRISIMQ